MTDFADIHRSDMSGIAWPPVVDGAGAVLAAYLRQLEQTQWLSPEEIARSQRKQLAVLADFLAAHSRFFAAKLGRAGLKPADFALPGALEKLPPLSRAELQRGEGVFCDSVPEQHLPVGETRTSGSTGEPVVVRRTAVNQLNWFVMTVRDHLWHGRDVTGKMALVRANIPKLRQNRSWGMPMNLLFHTGPSMGIPITTDVPKLYKMLAEFGPSNLLVYPSTLAALVDHMRTTGKRLESLRHLRSIGETLSPAVRAAARDVLGIEPADAYSSQELGYIALQCPESGLYHTMAETHVVEVVDDEGKPCPPGKVGRVLVTDLHNFATPLIRYAIGDYAEAGEPCSCGRGLPTLRRILGRERNLIRMPDGTRHWPLVGFDRFREIAGVRQYQLIQNEKHAIEVRLVTDAPVTAEQETKLKDHIISALGHPFELRFRYFDRRLPVPPSGKFEEFVCAIRD